MSDTAILAPVKRKSQSIRAVVTRADGRVENYGLISYWHRNFVINFVVNAYIKIKRLVNGR